MKFLASFLRRCQDHRKTWVIGVTSDSLAAFCMASGHISMANRLADAADTASALARFLSQKTIPARDGVGLILSNVFCRYLVIPWNPAFLQRGRAAVYLRSAFLDAYGDAARDWRIVSHKGEYERPQAACAIGTSLLNSVLEGCGQAKLKVAFCRPYLDIAFDYFQNRVFSPQGIFAVIEPDILTVLAWRDGALSEIDTDYYDASWKDALEGWRARNQLVEDSAFDVYVVCPPSLRGEPLSAENGMSWQFLDWPDDRQTLVADNPDYALPACAVL